MEDLPEYANLLGRGGETIATAAAKYLYLMGNFGEPWTTGVRNACLVLEKLDIPKEHQGIDIRGIIYGLNAILGDDIATYEYPGFIKLREFNFRTTNGYWNQDGTDNHGEFRLGPYVPTSTIVEVICLICLRYTRNVSQTHPWDYLVKRYLIKD